MANSGFEPTHVRGQDPFADLSVESTLIDPKYQLPSDLRALADRFAQESSPNPHEKLPPGSVTRHKVRVNQLGSGQSTQIGEMIPANMDVLMTAHLPTSFTLDDIAGDELGDARDMVRPVEDFSDEDEPKTVNAFIEQKLPPNVARVTRAKQPAINKPTSAERPLQWKKPSYDMIDTIEPDPAPTIPPPAKRASSPKMRAQQPSFPQNEITKTSFGVRPREPESTDLEPAFHDDLEQKIVFRDDIDDDLDVREAGRFNDNVAFGDIEPDPLDGRSFGEMPGYHADSEFAVSVSPSESASPSPEDKRSFDQILQRVRKPAPDVAPQRYIQTKITSNPKIGIMPEDTAIVRHGRDEEFDSASGFADGKRSLGTAEAEALTTPPRMISPYIIVGLGVLGAIAALVHAIQAPL